MRRTDSADLSGAQRLRGALVAAVALTTVIAPWAVPAPTVAGASATTGPGGIFRHVDDDGRAGDAFFGDCDGETPAYRRIQKAIDVSRRGDVILVCPGVYPGRLRIRDSAVDLTIRSVVPRAATIVPEPGARDGILVGIALASHVTIEGFTMRAAPPGACAGVGVMVGITHSSAVIRGNRIAAAEPYRHGCGAYSSAIRADYAPAGGLGPLRLEIIDNVIADFSEVGISVDADQVELAGTVAGNLVEQVHRPADRAPAHSGILLAEAGLDVVGNTIRTSTGTPRIGTAVYASLGGRHIAGNIIERVKQGITAEGSSFTIARNTIIDGTGTGIRGDWNGVSVRDNHVHGFAGTGLRFRGGNTMIEGNDFRRNGFPDCHDVAADEEGVRSNTWVDNLGEQSVPAGICRPYR